MNREHQLKFCRLCTKRKLDHDKGLLCSLTDEYAQFTDTCPDYDFDKEGIAKGTVETAYAIESPVFNAWWRFWSGVILAVLGGFFLVIQIMLEEVPIIGFLVFAGGVVMIILGASVLKNRSADHKNPLLDRRPPPIVRSHKPPLPKQRAVPPPFRGGVEDAKENQLPPSSP